MSVVLIVIDTLRADTLNNSYGHPLGILSYTQGTQPIVIQTSTL